ncbi:helix-turn-helix transcriptional regulator [Streptomyces lancefieldiae]|uniref:Helix-turn-helix transcriptional regulator n=1 Tax=Streptomyces lancefieldiae TaxID=3075520 RepID=A0ABU3B272_9ACTN|nr:helix-turn-helix transcriptional regulator [Streptomyces sp. DSM 40712]MDT0616536.1 helix-turn-helix transcriptional regulator [Streptomyces sp. DSM 40712]
MSRTGRPMSPIPDPNSPKGRLAGQFRAGRGRRGLTQEQMAAKVGTSIGTVQRAESGRVLPTLPMALAIATVCHLDEEHIESLWRKASRRGRKPHLTRARPLRQITDAAELGVALVRVWELNGCPSAREMERRVRERGEFGFLSHSAAWRIRERDQSVTSEKQLFAYLTACEVSEKSFLLWSLTWHRVCRVESSSEDTGDNRRRKLLHAAAAERHLKDLGLIPQERFPGSRVPWTVRCRRRKCRQISRIRYADVIRHGQGCLVCAASSAAPGSAPDTGRPLHQPGTTDP